MDPYRRFAISADKGSIQTRGPYRQGPPIDQGPLQTKNPYMIYMQGRKDLLQTRDPCKQEHLHYIQAKGPYRHAGRP